MSEITPIRPPRAFPCESFEAAATRDQVEAREHELQRGGSGINRRIMTLLLEYDSDELAEKVRL